jgi:hypothetical protein
MGRLLKNPDLAYGSTAAKLPIVPSGSAGDAPVTGLIRFNQANSRIEFYYNDGWNQVAKIGSVSLVVDNFPGDGTTQTFTMSQSESDPTSIAVFVGGVYQQPTTNYTVSGTAITFLSSPPPAYTGTSPTQVIVIHNINSTNVPA